MPLRLNSIHQIDALEGLKQIDDNSIDLVITDPPYNIASSNKSTIQQGKLISTKEAWGAWDTFHPFDYDLFILKVLSECYRILKKGGSLYMFTARENNGYFIRRAVERGFTYKNQLVLVKSTALPSWSKASWRSAFETCMYLTKCKAKTFNFLSQQECVNVSTYSIRHKKTRHPTEKPLDFIRKLVRISSNPNDVVLDPFMGSGTTAVACKETGRQFLGFELNADYLTMARDRLKQTKSDLTSTD
jgi:site-specific DNA-methyltransferase (adenine-specific)